VGPFVRLPIEIAAAPVVNAPASAQAPSPWRPIASRNRSESISNGAQRFPVFIAIFTLSLDGNSSRFGEFRLLDCVCVARVGRRIDVSELLILPTGEWSFSPASSNDSYRFGVDPPAPER